MLVIDSDKDFNYNADTNFIGVGSQTTTKRGEEAPWADANDGERATPCHHKYCILFTSPFGGGS